MTFFHEKDYVACICEGSSEMTIMNILLEKEALLFSRPQLLDRKVLSPSYYRNPRKFSDQYLAMDYEDGRVCVFLIQDRKTAKYGIRNPYLEKVLGPHYVITAPEIEMLMVHSLDLYAEYKKKQRLKKPCEFLAEKLKVKTSKLKSKDYIKQFYTKCDLIWAIQEHRRTSAPLRGSLFLADILKTGEL